MPDSLPYTPALEGRTLLDELNHRIKNELASVINLVTFKAVWTDNVEAKEELSNVVDLLHQHVQVHSILTMPDRDALVERWRTASKARTGDEPMQAGSHEHPPRVRRSCRWSRAGLAPGVAIYELVTNAVRHACFDGRDGEIKIRLMRAGSWVNCRVTDNGSGLEGSSLVAACGSWRELASSLGGRIDRTSGTIWNSFSLTFP